MNKGITGVIAAVLVAGIAGAVVRRRRNGSVASGNRRIFSPSTWRR